MFLGSWLLTWREAQTRTGFRRPACCHRRIEQRPSQALLTDFSVALERLETRDLLAASGLGAGVFEPFVTRTDIVAVPILGASPQGQASPTGLGLTPAQLRTAYGMDEIMFGAIEGDGTGQTIAIVNAYHNPNALTDLRTFNSTFGLPDPPSFRVLNQTGGTTYPAASNAGWILESSLDVQWAHAMAPAANIILFEANSPSYADLMTAVDTARSTPGVSVVSMSFGSGEFSSEAFFDSHFVTPAGHAGVTFVAATGDTGSPGSYPATSPNVVAVGGTSLIVDQSGTYVSETGWSGSGGGYSAYESRPSYQDSVSNNSHRSIPDVAMVGDPNTGVPVICSFNYGSAAPWVKVGGTSLSAPLFAGLIAVANQGRARYGLSSLDGATDTLPLLYSLPASDFHDITSGNNGGYSAVAGYDLVTGRGSPIANLLVPNLVGINVTLSIDQTSLAEDGGVATITATLSSASTEDVTIELGFSGTSTLSSDYTASDTQIVIAAGSLTGSISLNVTQDAADEANETLFVDITSVTNGAEAGVQSVRTAIIDDDASPTVTLSVDQANVAESGGIATFTATLSAASYQAITVGLAFSGTATLTNDYSRSSSQIVIPAGQTSASITTTPVSDLLNESDETIVVDINSVTNGTESGIQRATTAITDDDALPNVTLSASSLNIVEAGASSKLFVTLSEVSGRAVTVNVDLSGTATLTKDYSRSAAQITVPAGQTSAFITLQAVQDTLDEAAESIVADIGSVTNGAEAGDQQVTIALIDDDAGPSVRLNIDRTSIVENEGKAVVTATLSAVSGLDVTVSLTYSGLAARDTDYATSVEQIFIPAGATSGTVILTATSDTLDEPNETIAIEIGTVSNGTESGTQKVTTSITDDDAGPSVSLAIDTATITEEAATNSAVITATLSAISGQNVTINFGYSGSANTPADVSPSAYQLVIPAGSTTGTFSLTAVDDALNEATEQISAEILTVTNGTENGTQKVSASITDNDEVPDVELSIAATTLVEANGTTTVSAKLSEVSGQTVTVNLGFSGLAGLATDFTSTGAQIVIAPGQVTGSITLRAAQDSLDEIPEDILIDISSVTNGTELNPQQVSTTIVDDDAAPTAKLLLDRASIAEAGGIATVTAMLSTASGQDVTVDLELSGLATENSDYTASKLQVVIPAGATSRTMTITGVADALDEAGESVTVGISGVTNGTELNSQSVTTTITDDDLGPNVSIAIDTTTLAEDGGTTVITATLSSVSGQNVVVNLNYSGTAVLDADFSRSVTQILIPAGSTTGTVALTALVDELNETEEAIVIDVIAVANGSEQGVQQVVAMITDDDETPTVTLSTSLATIVEGGGATVVTATLSEISGQPVTVDLGFTGTALLTRDYVRTSGSIVIPAGAISASATLRSLQDSLDEPDETVIVDIAAVANGIEFEPQQVTTTITDDDIGPSVKLSLGRNTVAEAAGSITVIATLAALSGQPVTVNLVTSGTATTDTDFTTSSLQIVVPAGAKTAAITLTGVQDTLDEPNETVVFDIDTVLNGSELNTQQVTATITDDDLGPTVTLALDNASISEDSGTATVTATLAVVSGQSVVVSLGFSGTSLGTSDYTKSGQFIVIPAGELTGTATVSASQDVLDEPSETIVVDINSVANGSESGTQRVTTNIIDDDDAPEVSLSINSATIAEATGTATVTATLTAVSGQPVTVNLEFAGTARLSTDYSRSGTSIIVPAGALSASLALRAIQDVLDEVDENIVVDIASVTNGTETGTQSVSTTITDDDLGPRVRLTADRTAFGEAGGRSSFTATLSAVSGQDVTVDLAFSGTATLDTDYLAPNSRIVIPAGALSASTTVTAVQDTLDEANETVVVDISSVTNGSETATQQVVASISDDDLGPTVNLTSSALTLAEAGGVVTVTANLSVVSGQSVTVNFAYSGNATSTVDYTRSGGQIVIAPGATTGSITLTAIDDVLVDANETIIVDIATVINGTELGTQRITATIADDEASGLTAGPSVVPLAGTVRTGTIVSRSARLVRVDSVQPLQTVFGISNKPLAKSSQSALVGPVPAALNAAFETIQNWIDRI